jgi:hypothetical protein
MGCATEPLVANCQPLSANMAVFIASDKASGMTGTIVNLTMGSLDD